MPRRDYASEVSYDRVDDRRDTVYRRGVPVRERERDSETYVREGSRGGPAFLREDYGRSSAGPMVLRKTVTEDFDYARPRSLSPGRSRAGERETIVVKRDESESRVSGRRDRERDKSEREEIVIRRNESESRGPRSVRGGRREDDREEIVIRRDERESDRGSRFRDSVRGGREEIVIQRDDRERLARPPEFERERDEIIIRRDRDRSRPVYEEPNRDVRDTVIIRRDDFDDRGTAVSGRRREEDVVIAREASRERSRAFSRRSRSSSSSDEEIIIRRDEKNSRNGERKHEEIVIRKHSRSRSRSRSSSPTVLSERVLLEEPIVRAPPIHQEIITHHRHIDHGYEITNPYPRLAPRPISRPPSPPMPPISSAANVSEEKIEIRRSASRNGRDVEEDIIVKREDVRREPEFIPPEPARRIENTEISIRRREDDRAGYIYEDERFAVGRGLIPRASAGDIGRRYGRERDPTAGLWTEITKDLVVKEAIEEMGYEYEETDDFYYVIAYLRYDDVNRLVALSEDIRKDRRRRIKEIGWENRTLPEVGVVDDRRLAIEAGPYSPSRYREWDRRDWDRRDFDRGGWDREDERYIEREVVYRGGRPPPPIGWRRGY